MKGRLAGFHKVYVDPSVSYRMVIQFRTAPPTSHHKHEIYLVAAGSRKDYSVYRSAYLRTGPRQDTETSSATETRVQAARSRSPHAIDQPTVVPATPPAAAQPNVYASRKAPQR
ncbi:hypothetical protein [Streptomyces sp. NPDC002215]|uniref:hypothetical protein n=1 Tax=Streptomyces sp. NPDC002215 TaxID=3154412 RepID=UPI00332FED90